MAEQMEERKVGDPVNLEGTVKISAQEDEDRIMRFPVHDLKCVFAIAVNILESVRSFMVKDNIRIPSRSYVNEKIDEKYKTSGPIQFKNYVRLYKPKVTTNVCIKKEHYSKEEELRKKKNSVQNKEAAKIRVPVFFIKNNADQVKPVESCILFRSDQAQDPDLRTANENFMQHLDSVLDLVPATQRQNHFRMVDRYQYLHHAMNKEFKTNLLDMDSMRIYETLAVSRDILWPVSSTVDDDEYNVLFMCPPTGGVVSGTKMFLDLIQPQLNTDWIALTRHPWQEGTELENIVVNDSILHWEKSKWRFLLDQDLAITTTEQVEKLVLEVKVRLEKKPDLVIADLSPSQVNMESQGYELYGGLGNALLTEAGQVDLSLRVLEDGGNFILSLTNPVDLTCTIGNLGFLSGLFSTVAVVFPRPSSTWLRPAMLVCSGYVGVDSFQAMYPDFLQDYLNDVALKCVRGHYVMLDTSGMAPSVTSALVEMGDMWVIQEEARLYMLRAAYADTHNISQYDRMLDEQLYTSQDWIREIIAHVAHTRWEWNVTSEIVQVCDEEIMLNLKPLWEIESQLTDEAMDFSLNRLQETYIDGEILFPDEMNVSLKFVETIKDGKMELMPSTMSYSRFASVEKIYDYLIARKVGSFFPVEGLSLEIKSEVSQTCGNHIKRNLQKALEKKGFGIYVDDRNLVVACLNFSTCLKVSLSECDMHKKIFETLLTPIKGPRLMDKNDSLFACMMPLTSRLLLGAACIIRGCFKLTSLVISKPDRMMGVLFQGFSGHRHPKTVVVKNRLESMISEMENNKEVDMEIIPFSSLIDCVDLASLIEYNDAILNKSTLTIVNVLIASLKEYYEP